MGSPVKDRDGDAYSKEQELIEFRHEDIGAPVDEEIIGPAKASYTEVDEAVAKINQQQTIQSQKVPIMITDERHEDSISAGAPDSQTRSAAS